MGTPSLGGGLPRRSPVQGATSASVRPGSVTWRSAGIVPARGYGEAGETPALLAPPVRHKSQTLGLRLVCVRRDGASVHRYRWTCRLDEYVRWDHQWTEMFWSVLDPTLTGALARARSAARSR